MKLYCKPLVLEICDVYCEISRGVYRKESVDFFMIAVDHCLRFWKNCVFYFSIEVQVQIFRLGYLVPEAYLHQFGMVDFTFCCQGCLDMEILSRIIQGIDGNYRKKVKKALEDIGNSASSFQTILISKLLLITSKRCHDISFTWCWTYINRRK